MAAVLGPLIINAVLAIGGTVGVGIAITHAVIGAAVLGASYFATRALTTAPTLPSFSAEARGRNFTIKSSVEAHKIIYGRIRTAGVMVFAETTDSALFKNYATGILQESTKKNQYLHLILVMAGHEVEEIETIFIGDKEVALDEDDYVTNPEFIDTSNKMLIRIKKHLGMPNQVADTYLEMESPSWTTDHRLQGLCYLYVRLQYVQANFPNGVPEIRCIIKGKKLYDPRTDTTQYSTNWALCVLDYVSNEFYGIGARETEVDMASFIAAANTCDEDVDLLPSGTQKRYTCNGVMDTSVQPIDNMTRLATAAAGSVTYSQGKFYCHAGVYDVPVMEVDETFLRGALSVQTRTIRQNLFNAVKGTYVYPEDNWQPTDFPVVTNPLYVEQDGDILYRDIELPFTTDPQAAQRIAKIILEKSRQCLMVTMQCNMKPLQLKVWDVVTLTNTLLGFENKPFRIFNWSMTKDGGIDLQMQEEAAESYDWNFGEAQTVDPAPNTNLPDPYSMSGVTDLVLESGTEHLLLTESGDIVTRLFVQFSPSNDAYAISTEIEYKESTSTVWVSQTISADLSSLYIAPVASGVFYDIRVRAANGLGVKSDWMTIYGYKIEGKTVPPKPPSNFTIFVQADGTREFAFSQTPLEADVKSGGGFEIRYKKGVTSDWNTMAKLHSGLLTNSPFESNALEAGEYIFACKTVDSSGNYSNTAVFIVTEIGNPRVENALYQSAEHIDWDGTLTNCFNDFSILRAISTETWDDLPATWDALSGEWDTIVAQENTMSYETNVIDLGGDISFSPKVTTVGGTTIVIEAKTGSEADGDVVGAYAPVPARVTGKRYIKFRVTVTGGTPFLQTMTVILYGTALQEEFEDINTATETATWFSKIAPGHFKIKSKMFNFSILTQATILAIQNVGAGFSWELISKTALIGSDVAAEFKVYNSLGVLSDATLDLQLKGVE